MLVLGALGGAPNYANYATFLMLVETSPGGAQLRHTTVTSGSPARELPPDMDIPAAYDVSWTKGRHAVRPYPDIQYRQ